MERDYKMQEVILVIHLLVALALVVTILLQRSEGGALGIGGGQGSGLMTSRSAANLLTRSTTVLAVIFFTTSLTLAILAGKNTDNASVLDKVEAIEKIEPKKDAVPEVPVSK